jgi:hypothetical protein
VEADIGRYKRVIGDALRSRTEGRQTTEVAIAVASLNRMLIRATKRFKRTPGAGGYVRRNKVADRLARRAPDQPFRNLPPPPFLFRHLRVRRGAWHGADDLR